MKAVMNFFGKPSPVKRAFIYRLSNECVLVRLDMTDKWSDVEHSILYEGETQQLHINICEGEKIFGFVAIIPENFEEKKLFSNAYFMKMLYKHRIHYYIAPKISVDLEPEEIELITIRGKK